MAKTIEELDFKLKIDRKDFDKEITEANKQAAKLNMELSKLLEIKKSQGNLTNKEYLTLKRLDNLESNRRINADKEAVSAARRAKAIDGMADSQRRYNQDLVSQNRLLSEAKNIALSYVSIWGAKKLLSELVQVTGEFEIQRTTLKAMLQDANGANAIYEQIKQLAVVSPFGFKELVTYTKQLAAYSVPIGELYDTTKMLADVSAGLGVGMDRLVLAYGQVRSAAFLRGQEVRQFTEAGIPILDMLAKQFEELEGRAVSAGEVFDKISKRLVPFEMVAKAFKDMTSEGGKFYNMQEIQAETLQGKISNLKDAYEIMLNEIGQNLEPIMKGAVDTLRNLMANYEDVGRAIIELVAVYGTYRTALLLSKVLTHDFGATLRLLEINFKKVSKTITGVIFKNPYALIAAGATAAVYAIYKLIDGFVGASRMMENYNRNMAKMESGIASETAALDALYAKLEVAKEGTKDYESARKTIYTKYSEYIAALNEEGVAVDNLATLYAKLKEKVQEAAREKFLRTALSDADEDFATETDRIYKSFSKRFEKGMVGGPKGFSQATAKQKEAMWQYITGGVSYDELRNYVPAGWAGFIDWMRKDFRKAADEYKQIVADIGEIAPAFDGTAAISNYQEPDNTDDAFKNEIDRLQKRIALIEKLRDVYESMRPYFTNDQIREFFAMNFGFVDGAMWENFDFDSQIQGLVSQLDNLGEKGKEVADTIREKLAVALEKDLVDEAKKAAKEVEEFTKRVDKYVEEAKSVSDKIQDLETAMASDLDRETNPERKDAIILHYTTEIEKLKEELTDLTSIQLTDFWQQLTGEKNGTYGNLTRLQRTAEKLRDALKDIQPNRDKNGKITGYTVTNTEKNGNILDMLGIDADEVQLTVSQVETLNKAIDKLISKRADKNGILALFDAISQEGGFKSFWKDIVNGSGPAIDILQGTSKQISELGSILSDLGEATDSDFLKSLGETFSFLGGFMDKLAQGDLLGAVGEVVKVFTSWITASAKLNAAIANAAKEAERLNAELKLSAGVDTIFGENALAKMRNAISLMREYGNVVEANRNQANRSITWKSGLFNWGRSSKSLTDMVSELGYDLYDAYGNLNANALQAILDTYENLASADRAWIEDAIKNSEIYADAMEQMREAMKDTWGSVASDMADKLITARKKVGDAYHALADDLRVTFADMADDIAHKLVESFIIDNILENYTDDLERIYNMMGSGASEDRIAGAFASMTDSIIKDSEMAAEFTNRIYDALERYGISFEQGSENLADGIKGITEDTANLLASYLNAIRGDVSYSKVQRDNILAEIKNLASYVASPTLMDYLNRIQANTFDTAQNTHDLLSELRSMMTTDGGFTALRVYS